MKIALISTTTYSTPAKAYGGEVYVYWLSKALDELGHDVTLFATYDSIAPEHGRLIPLGKAPQGDFITMLKTEYDIITYYTDILKKCDVVHDFSHNGQIAKWCRENGVSHLNTLWGNSFWGNRLGLSPFDRSNVVCWSEAHKHIGVINGNGYEETPWYNKYPFTCKLRESTKVVLGGVDTDFFTPSDKPREDWFLWFSRAHESKGIDLAIEIAKRNPELTFKFSGSFTGMHKVDGDKYRLQIAELPNCEYIDMPLDETHHEFKRELYRRCKALLFTVQYQESFGLIPVEALSTGCPVIASDRGSMPEIIDNGVNGFMCSDMVHYENAMRCIEHIKPETVRENTVRRFNMKRVAEDYIKVYECAIRGELW